MEVENRRVSGTRRDADDNFPPIADKPPMKIARPLGAAFGILMTLTGIAISVIMSVTIFGILLGVPFIALGVFIFYKALTGGS